MGSPFLNEPQQSATAQGVADEPANVDNIETTPPNMGMQVYPRPQIELPQDMPVAPKAERRKLSIDEQIAQAEDERQAAQDAEIKPQSFWKDFGAKLIQGADVFFNGTKAPIVGWGRLKHDAAVDRANAKLNPLIEMRKRQMADVKANQDIQMNNLEYTLKTNKGMQDMFNNDPDVLLIKQSNRVTPEQASRLNAKYGSSYTPAYWGKFVEKQVGEQSFIRPEDRANYAPNTSLPIDRTESTVSVPLSGGGTGYTTSKDAVKQDNDMTIAGIGANRQIATTDANNKIEVDTKNANILNDWQKTAVDNVWKRQSAVASLLKDIPSGGSQETAIRNRMNDIGEELNTLNNTDLPEGTTQEDRVKRVQKLADDYSKLQQDLLTEVSKTEAGRTKAAQIQQAIAQLPSLKLGKPSLVPYTKVDLGKTSSGQTTTLDQATQYYKGQGLTGAALKQAIDNARKMGMIK